jgi:DNA-binding NtrC family response regulator
VYDLLARIAESDASVLICGESGTGKELAARALHRQGPRSAGPFVAVSCSAIPEGLLESELFGHVRGAFTDARFTRAGLFVQASGGTLFLDEIGDLPLGLQPKLLRALQERTVRPVGGEAEIPFDVRLIAATNRDLELEVRDGRFRQDLFYRLNVVHIALPPLRERRDDIPILIEHFLARYAEQYGMEPRTLAPDAAAALREHSWPGNIRELQNAIERAFALSPSGTIGIVDLPPAITRAADDGPSIDDDTAPAGLPTLADAERELIAATLRKTGGNKNEAARLLGIDRQRLYRKIEKYRL